MCKRRITGKITVIKVKKIDNPHMHLHHSKGLKGASLASLQWLRHRPLKCLYVSLCRICHTDSHHAHWIVWHQNAKQNFKYWCKWVKQNWGSWKWNMSLSEIGNCWLYCPYFQYVICLVHGHDVSCDFVSIHKIHIQLSFYGHFSTSLLLCAEQKPIEQVTVGNLLVLTHCKYSNTPVIITLYLNLQGDKFSWMGMQSILSLFVIFICSFRVATKPFFCQVLSRHQAISTLHQFPTCFEQTKLISVWAISAHVGKPHPWLEKDCLMRSHNESANWAPLVSLSNCPNDTVYVTLKNPGYM